MTDSQHPPSTNNPRREIRLRFGLGGHQDFFLDELGAIQRHPYLVVYYLASMSVSFVLSISLDLPPHGIHSFALLVPILAFATLVGILTGYVYVHLAAFLRPHSNPLAVLMSVPLFLSIVATQCVTMLLWNVLLDVPATSLPVTLGCVFAVYIGDELIIRFFVRGRSARIVEDVRSFDRPALPRHAPPRTTEGRAVVTAGNARLDATSILHMRAQGNNVMVFTDSAPVPVPGPFSAIVAQLPEDLGCFVHRSEWVATRAVTRALREGRATLLVLSTGTTVRVASTRAGVVRDWLAQFDKKPARRRVQLTGGGDTKRQSRPAPEITTSAIGATAPSAPRASVMPTKS